MLTPISATNRSKITNGTRRHVRARHGGVDGRSRTARRWRDLYLGFESELGHKPSTAEDALLRSAADLALRAETLSAEIASGRTIDDGELNRLAFSLRRTLAALGLGGGKAAEDSGPTLEQLLAERGAGS